MSTTCLSHYADYRCQHSGACCTSNWPIHIEPDRARRVQQAIADDALRLPAANEGAAARWIVDAADCPPDSAGVLGTDDHGACVFYAAEERRCSIHRDLGDGALPSACQHFPRRCLIERDAVFVSLSHYCPTVARMALADRAARGVVAAPDSLVGHLHLEGLDARDVLPPLLRPGMLADLDGYHAWERAVVWLLEDGDLPDASLARVCAMTRLVQAWRPGRETLAEAVERAAAACRLDAAAREVDAPDAEESRRLAAFEIVRGAVPGGLRPPAAAAPAGADAAFVAPAWARFSRPLGRFLAAHAFGNWCAYLGSGIPTVVRSLEAALAVVRVEAARRCAAEGRVLDESILIEAFRAADLLLVHLVDPKELAAGLDQQAGRLSYCA